MIRLLCPSCGKRYQAEERYASRAIKCTNCNTTLVVSPGEPQGSDEILFAQSPPAEKSQDADVITASAVPWSAATANTGNAQRPGSSTYANPYATPTGQQFGKPYESPASGRVKAPAVALLIVAIISAFLFLAYGILNASVVSEADLPVPKNEAEATQLKIGFAIGVSLPFVLILPQLVVLVGAISMMRMKSYGMAMTATILSMIPCFGCLGFPFGIWALVVLASADVKQEFDRRSRG